MSTSNKSKTKWINILLILSFIFYVSAQWFNQILPFKYWIIILLIVLVVFLIALIIKSKVIKILVILILLGIGSSLYYSQSLLYRFISSQTTQTFNLSVLVLENSSYQSLDDLSGKSVGYSNTITKDMMNKFNESLNKKLDKTDLVLAKDDLDLAGSLFNEKVSAIIINEANRSFYEETYENFSSTTRVLDKLSISQKTELTQSNVKAGDTFTILISGIDTNGPISTVSRSDVNILMTISPKQNKIFTVSIPRDTWVDIPCIGGYDKLTHSGIYGVDCTMQTIENFLGVPVNYYAKVNFTSFIDILNVVGPITVNSHYSFIGYQGTQFYQGLNTLTADQALEFSRTRYTVEGGDYTRGLHQQEVIKAIIAKLGQSVSVTNVNSIVDALSRSIESNISSSVLNGLVQKQILENPNWTVDLLAIVGTGDMRPTTLYPYQNLWISYPDENLKQQAITTIKELY